MARNRNNYRREVRTARREVNGRAFPGAMAAILVVAAAGCIGYLGLTGRNDDLGRRIKELEKKRTELERLVVNEEFKLANATSPENIQRLLVRHQLNMILPRETNIVRAAAVPLGVYAGDHRAGRAYAAGAAGGRNE
jgi:hypothetical protein